VFDFSLDSTGRNSCEFIELAFDKPDELVILFLSRYSS
jgi:hypothetical protein